MGSVLKIRVSGTQITGLYQTTHGKPKFEEKFKVTGFTDGEVVGLVVLWEGYDSLTSWTGKYGLDEDGEYIISMWHLVRKFRSPGDPAEEWDSFLANSGAKWYYREPLDENDLPL